MIIADDESVIIRGIQKLLDWESMGIQIVGEYTDGRQALDGILALQPDIALLDISMPGLTGIDVLRELGNHNAKTSVIFISGFQDFEYAKSAVRFGAKDYLLKPIIRSELLAALERCVPIRSEKEPLFSTEKDYSALLGMEENHYVTVTANPLFGDTDTHLKKLKQFSLMGTLERRPHRHRAERNGQRICPLLSLRLGTPSGGRHRYSYLLSGSRPYRCAFPDKKSV